MIPKIIHQIYWDFSGNNNPPPKDWLTFSKNIRNTPAHGQIKSCYRVPNLTKLLG